MVIARKYRIYPNEQQKVLLAKHFGACRFIYNLALETKIAAYSGGASLSRYDLQFQLKDLKTECEWLNEINSQSLQSELMHLDSAYLKFFKGLARFPRFKSKSDKKSFQCPQNAIIENELLWLPKFKSGIKIILHRPVNGILKTATISQTTTGKYFVSFVVKNDLEIPDKAPVNSDSTVGIDVGLKTFAVLSDGKVYANPKHLKASLKRLKVLQKRASKKKKGSNNLKKANLKVGLLHEKITNQRSDFAHKFSDAITKQYDTICVENLNIAGMVKNHKLALSINDAGWSTALDLLKYKSEWRGKNYHEIGRFDASSKIHNKCGFLNKELNLSDRLWLCPKCGEMVDRDKNAAINIKVFGLNFFSGTEQPVEPAESPTLVGTLKQETNSKD